MYSKYTSVFVQQIESLRKIKKLTKEIYEKAVEETDTALKEPFKELVAVIKEQSDFPENVFSELQDNVLNELEKSRKTRLSLKSQGLLERDKAVIALILIPAVRKMEVEYTEEFSQCFMDCWNKRYWDSPFKLAEYEKIRNGFAKKVFGIF